MINRKLVRTSFIYVLIAALLLPLTALTRITAGVMRRVSYAASGGPSSETSSVGNPYLFHGRRYDPETQLYYYRARFYDPKSGRFLQRDSIGVWTDGGNLGNGYTFVANDPVNGKDPRGLKMTLDQCGLWTDFDAEGGPPIVGGNCVGGECVGTLFYTLHPDLLTWKQTGGGDPSQGCFISGNGGGGGGGTGDVEPPTTMPDWCVLGNTRTNEFLFHGGQNTAAMACYHGCGGIYTEGVGIDEGSGTCELPNGGSWSCADNVTAVYCNYVPARSGNASRPLASGANPGRPAPSGSVGTAPGVCSRTAIRQVRGLVGPTEFIRRPTPGLIR
ncbi:MAG: RHS repeat-associated core domain-containing protein [Acidobacteria bacterium]|nr:RHS repeat-associated core domain-containing protein [Acidobacteriota bacterium]